MLRTPNLNLPIYNDPDNDVFDIQEWNDANGSIDVAYEQLKNIKDEIITTNPIAEVIEARKGEESLGVKINKIDVEFVQLKNYLSYMPINGGDFDGNQESGALIDGGVY